jgi:poly(3-hydroxybutyrate) depolymerase
MNPYSYQMHEMAYLAFAPVRAASDAARLWFRNPINPLSQTAFGRNVAASAEIFERLTRRYTKPAFNLTATLISDEKVAVKERIVWERAFCKVLRFEKQSAPRKPQPKLLIIAPMSGHYATLLRGTVETFLPTHDVYITDWVDARTVPLAAGAFDLDDYIDYLIAICHALNVDGGAALHTLGVCQPSVPLLAAVARMEAEQDPHVPASMTLIGGPIDTRRNPTAVNMMAAQRGTAWFRDNCIYPVPFAYPGSGRHVYPGCLQLSGFVAMNLERHVNAHVEMFNHMVQGDGDSAEKHRAFYDEYLAVMDLTAEFYLQTVDTVFVRHLLPKGEMTHRGVKIDPAKIVKTGLMTVEGEKDDISGIGQTAAALDLCCNIPAAMKTHYEQKDVGHYGVFNGSRFRNEIAPRIREFHAQIEAHAARPSRKKKTA